MAWFVLVADVAFALTAFGVRAWLHWRSTGSTGLVGVRGGPVDWVSGGLFVAAVLALGAAPLVALTPSTAPDGAGWKIIAVALMVAGLLATLWSQAAMGASWRV